MNSAQSIENQKLALEIETLKVQLTEAQAAIEAGKRQRSMLQEAMAQDFDKRVEAEAQAKFDQQRAIDADAADRANPKPILRPNSLAEYQALTPREKAKVLELYGGSVVPELLEQRRRESRAAASAEVQTKLARQRAIHPGRPF